MTVLAWKANCTRLLDEGALQSPMKKFDNFEPISESNECQQNSFDATKSLFIVGNKLFTIIIFLKRRIELKTLRKDVL